MKQLLALLAAFSMPALAQTNWHHPLYLDGGGYWQNRVKVTFQSTAAQSGTPQVLTIGERGLNLQNAEARSLRVLDESGAELLFNLTAADGSARHEGAIQNGDQLTVPLETGANEKRALWIYWGNLRARLVPDFLPGGFANAGAENGGESPTAWRADGADNEHVLQWTNGGRSGKKALYAEAKAGAAPNWFKWVQTGVPVSPGQKIEFAAWTKGENIVGTAGWYIHVNGAKPQLINQVIKAGDGSFDWKEAKLSFTVPEGGATMDIGTVLYGTGKAWFDDVTLNIESAATGAVQSEIAPVETMNLGAGIPPASGQPTAFPFPRGINFVAQPIEHDVRLELSVRNFGAARKGALITADLTRALLVSRLPKNSEWHIVNEELKQLPARLENGILTFQADLNARWEDSFYVFLEKPIDQRPAARPIIGGNIPEQLPPNPQLPEAALAEGPPNLLKNGSFESGGELPDGWELSAQKADGKAVGTARRVRSGKDGDWCVELTVPEGSAPNWTGWHQFVPVTGGAKYLIGTWIKTKNSGGAQLHAHWRDEAKQLVKNNAFTGAGPMVSGTQDWTRLETVVTAPPDAKFVEIHLTTNTTGTLWHDGVIVRQLKETIPASVETQGVPGEYFSVWPMATAIKVFKDDPIGIEPQSLAVWLARNEYEPLQLVLKSGKARDVKVEVSPLKNAAGAALPVEITRVGYVPVDYPTNYYRLDNFPAWKRRIPTQAIGSDGWAGDWPDPLYPVQNGGLVKLTEGEAQPLYFTVHAPENAAPGEYKATISIGAKKIPFTARVWNFTLPKTPSLQVTFDCRGPKQPSAEAWYRFLAAHRVSPGYLPEPQFKLENGAVKADFTAFDKAATLCFDELGMSTMYTPDQFYALGWAFSPRKFLGTTAFTPEWEKTFGSALKQYYDHVKAKGWLNKFTFYLSDEPFDTPEVAANLQKFSQFVQKTAPGLPIYSSTWKHMPALNGAVTRWGAGHYGVFPVDKIAERLKAGDSVWFTTDGQQCLDTPYLGTERILPWYCFKYGARGYEFWGVNWWTYDPHQFGWHNYIAQSDSEKDAGYYIRYPNGDGYLAYPGETAPVSSIRLEAVRDGIEDYELFHMIFEAAKRAGQPQNSVAPNKNALVRKIKIGDPRSYVSIPNAGGRYSSKNQSDPTEVLKFRDRFGNMMDMLR